MKLVYFIENVQTRAIKIGTAVDPDARIRQLQTGADAELRLIGAIVPSVIFETTERQLHKRFSSHRLTGEWFAPVIHRDVLAILAMAQRA